MRSACWGARSVRSLTTMRPLVVSMTMAFALSRLAGSGWASAGAAHTSAARRLRIRIMKTPRVSRLAGEYAFQARRHGSGNEGGDVAAHRSDLTHQCGGDRADA